MQIERVNNYEFRIYLTADELLARQIDADTFAYGTQAYRKLMAQIIRELETYHDFSHDDRPLRTEVTPLSGGDLYISVEAFEEADEVDPRFSSFAISVYDSLHPQGSDDDDDDEEDEEGADEDSDVEEPEENSEDEQADVKPDPNLFFRGKNPVNRLAFDKYQNSESIIIFATYEDMMQAISAINTERFVALRSSLYMEIEDKRLYLLFKFPKDIGNYRTDFAILNDYGRFAPCTQTIRAYIAEHCRCIFPSKAFEKLTQ